MKKFNIAKPEKYLDKQGVEKTAWKNVGEYIEFEKQDGSVSRMIEIPAIGLKANVFPIQPKEDKLKNYGNEIPAEKPVAAKKEDVIEYPEEEVDLGSIPF